MNLSEMDENNSKRLVDFSAGLIFGLHGSIERVTNKVFLLTPRTSKSPARAKPIRILRPASSTRAECAGGISQLVLSWSR